MILKFNFKNNFVLNLTFLNYNSFLNKNVFLFFTDIFFFYSLLNLIKIKNVLNLFLLKILKKKTKQKKKIIFFSFKKNFYFLCNKVKTVAIGPFKKKQNVNNTGFHPLFSYFNFYILKNAKSPHIGTPRQKLLFLNEPKNFYFLKPLKNKKSKKKKLKKKQFFRFKIKSIFLKKFFNNFFLFFKKKKLFSTRLHDNNLFFSFFYNRASFFSFKKNYFKFFLFLNNNFGFKIFKHKYVDFLENVRFLEKFYFTFFFSLKKKISKSKNFKNKYFNKFVSSRFKLSSLGKKKIFNQKKIFLKPYFFFNPNFFFLERKKNDTVKKKVSLRSIFFYFLLRKKNTYNHKFRFFFYSFLTPLFYSFFFKNKCVLKNYLCNSNAFAFRLKKKKLKALKYLFKKYKKFFTLLPLFQKKQLVSKKKIFERPIIISNARMKIKKIFKFKFKRFKFFLKAVRNPSKLNTKLLVTSKYLFSFKHKLNGFLFLHRNNFFKSMLNFSFFYKKIMYSFLNKNELQRYILKKYLRRFSALSQNSASTKFLYASDASYKNSFLIERPSSSISQIILNKHWKFFEKTLSYTKFFDADSADVLIKKIKFKPGYMSQWREARNVLKKTWNLHFRYQQKLTKYLLKYKKFVKHSHITFEHYKLNNVILYSKLLLDLETVNLFVKNGLFFVNGLLTLNLFTQIFKNDFVQLIVSQKYYIFFKWSLNSSIIKKTRLRHKSKSKMHSARLADDKQKSFNLSYWIINNKNLIMDVPNFIEVDYYTLSIFCLSNNVFLNDLNPYTYIDVRYGVLNLYNWKYIN